jgi:hypothetical protein
MDAIEQMIGERLTTCPWAGYRDPFVLSVLEAAYWFDKGQLSTRLGPRPSAVMMEAVSHYTRVQNVVRAKMQEQQMAEHKKRVGHG